jgi:hypothetical protein
VLLATQVARQEKGRKFNFAPAPFGACSDPLLPAIGAGKDPRELVALLRVTLDARAGRLGLLRIVNCLSWDRGSQVPNSNFGVRWRDGSYFCKKKSEATRVKK